MNTENMPLVSFVIPVYNGANFMQEAINSALNQTYTNIEIIVVNDGSTDDGATHEIALSYGDKIRYFQKENGGVSSALNLGIREMKGKYFAWLSHDDLHLPHKVEKQMQAIHNYKGDKPVLCVCNYSVIDEKGDYLFWSRPDIGEYFVRSPKCFLGAEPGMMINGDATLIDKVIFEKCGYFSEVLRASQETDMWLRSLDVAEFVFLEDYLVDYRSHSQQVTHQKRYMVGEEAGEYRGKIVEQLTTDEIMSYYRNKEDARRFGYSTFAYASACFYYVTQQMVKKIHQLFKCKWELLPDVFEGMFEFANYKKLYAIVNNALNTDNKNPKILVYFNEELAQNSNAIEFINKMRLQYNLIFAYSGDLCCNVLDDEIVVRFGEEDIHGYRHIYIALLAMLLDAKVLWYNTGYIAPIASPFSYTRGSDVFSLFSHHYSSLELAMVCDMLFNHAQAETHRSNATIVTTNYSNPSLAPFAHPSGSAIVPPLMIDGENSNRWYDFWDIVLASESVDGLRDRLGREFEFHRGYDSAEETPSTELVLELQRFLTEHEIRELEKIRDRYEKNIYWRLTSPLRFIVVLVRRILGRR